VLQYVRSIAAERGAAVLLSTHLLTEVEENCSRVLIINRGRVVAEGTVAEIVRKAAAPRSGRLNVAPEHAVRAAEILATAREVDEVTELTGQPGSFTVTFAAARNGSAAPNDALRALLESGVALRSFELEGARLSDAFLKMTEAR
jgi:ABC-2 type transport system ATP-binding protein